MCPPVPEWADIFLEAKKILDVARQKSFRHNLPIVHPHTDIYIYILLNTDARPMGSLNYKSGPVKYQSF